jgi:hypothetical protein
VYRFLIITLFIFLPAFSFAQPYYAVPNQIITKTLDGLSFSNQGISLSYVNGLGWLDPNLNTPLIQNGDTVYASIELFEQLGLPSNRLLDIRLGGTDKQRIVLDVADINSSVLQSLQMKGDLSAQSLNLSLPELLIPLELATPPAGITITQTPNQTLLNISYDAIRYEVFGLENPQRIVIDLFTETSQVQTQQPAEQVSLPQLDILPSYSLLKPGVTYQRLSRPSKDGESTVHILEMQAGSGQFRVVGQQQGGNTISRLSDGAYAAINAGYFDPQSFSAIGFLKIDNGLLSLPSRNRASFGINGGTTYLDRVSSSLELISGVSIIYEHNLANSNLISLHTDAQTWVGDPSVGVITVLNGKVIENKIGPRQVPQNGFAFVYAPTIRELALLNPGDALRYRVKLEPNAFESVPYAVEAGPLLLKDGQAVFSPELEQFKQGERILDAVTQQAAIATTFSGSTLFIAAENMTAKDLIPLLQSLNVKDAMRLDSGSSTSLVIDGKLINRRFERPITSAIVFISNP